MRVEVRFRGLEPSEPLRDHTVRRIHFHLSRFGHQLSAVLVRIGDINGPKGGVDKRCQVTVRGPRFGSSTLDDMSGDAYSAVDLAVERIARVVRRELERAHSAKRGGPSVRGGHEELPRLRLVGRTRAREQKGEPRRIR